MKDPTVSLLLIGACQSLQIPIDEKTRRSQQSACKQIKENLSSFQSSAIFNQLAALLSNHEFVEKEQIFLKSVCENPALSCSPKQALRLLCSINEEEARKTPDLYLPLISPLTQNNFQSFHPNKTYSLRSFLRASQLKYFKKQNFLEACNVMISSDFK